MKNLIPILFALGTALCWGMYGPALSKTRGSWSPFKPYVFIGVAYLVIAVTGGLAIMKMMGDSFSYSGEAAPARSWGFIAGSLGALGALFLTTAVMKSKGNTALVMPIVFGGAVTVNAIVSYVLLRNNPDIHVKPQLWVGMLIVFLGVVLVAKYTPHAPKPKPAVMTPVAAEADDAGESDDTARIDETTR